MDIFACKATSTLNILVFCLLKGSRLLANSVKANELGVLGLCDDGLEYRTSDDVTSVGLFLFFVLLSLFVFFLYIKKKVWSERTLRDIEDRYLTPIREALVATSRQLLRDRLVAGTAAIVFLLIVVFVVVLFSGSATSAGS